MHSLISAIEDSNSSHSGLSFIQCVMDVSIDVHVSSNFPRVPGYPHLPFKPTPAGCEMRTASGAFGLKQAEVTNVGSYAPHARGHYCTRVVWSQPLVFHSPSSAMNMGFKVVGAR